MRIRRHFEPFQEFTFDQRFWKWIGIGAGMVLLGYLTAFFIIFPAPILPGHHAVPRVLGLTVAEAQAEVRKANLQTVDGGAEPHPSAAAGVVVWQDPPPDVVAPEHTKVTLVSSAGPPKIPVPDVANLDAGLAQSLIQSAGLVVSQVESVQAAAPSGLAMMTRPPAGTALTPGAGLTIVVSRGAPTIPVPDLLGLGSADARTRLEMEGLQLGTVTRRRTGDAAPGSVVAQSPGAGTLAAPGTVVDIVVARSPQ
ncbi:MAG TPA: PASTA domain-containing protein [Gemmatimonadales bacterium]|jgi:serine/threonine-protein kinase|nr:PASTA domain-containing protein [Gemmatimonadales bacterium]